MVIIVLNLLPATEFFRAMMCKDQLKHKYLLLLLRKTAKFGIEATAT
jgi:hypothetical protein